MLSFDKLPHAQKHLLSLQILHCKVRFPTCELYKELYCCNDIFEGTRSSSMDFFASEVQELQEQKKK